MTKQRDKSASVASKALAERRPGPSRRGVLKGGTALGLAAGVGFYAPAVIASDRIIKIGSYGGYFENSFVDHIYPEFTKATGIKVQSVTQPNSSEWLTTMEQATRAGAVPADLSLYGKDTMIRGTNMEILKAFDMGKVPNAGNLNPIYLFGGGSTVGIGAMAWYTSMVVNTDLVKPAPESWAEFWDPKYEGKLGMAANYDARLLDIAAATFFDGPKTLETKDGITAVIAKVAELKPNVKIWWKAENVMQNALQNEEVVAGMYYHDVAGIMASEGFPVASIFPKESNVVGYGSWCLSPISEKVAEAHEFVNFSCDPATQALMSRKIGTAPLVPKAMTGLTDEEFAAVASEKEPIVPAYESYLAMSDFISDSWNKMLVGA